MTISSTDSFVLESYGYNLTRLAREWIFPPLKGYEAVVSRIFDILLRKEKTKLPYNPLLIDGDETRRWQVVLEVLRRLTTGDAPDTLPSLQVIAPNFVALCGASPAVVQQDVTGIGPGVEGKLAQLLVWPSLDAWCASDVIFPRFEAFFSVSCQAENHVLLLLNDFHRFVGGDPLPDAINIAPLLGPALARRQIQLLGTSTLAQYRQYIERDAAIQRRVQPVVLRSDEEIQQKSSSQVM
jgi:ATP-dependent Clp protease ATP-binding subunit ClpC